MPDRKLVMVVEDDEDIQKMLALILDLEGYDSMQAGDGLEALAKLQNAHPLPNLIIVDLMMPHMSGEEFVHRMRGTPTLAKIPVLILSGDMRARAIAEKMGARTFLPKPVGLDVLSASVREAIE